MAKVLLTWEGGAYLGHEMKVTAAAAVLKAAGHAVVIVAPHGTAANAAAQRHGLGWQPLPAPPDTPWPAANVPWKSWASMLWQFGFQSAEMVDDRFRAWDALFQREQPDVVLAESAPFAILSARVLQVPVAEIGVGYNVPPAWSPFPPFRDAEAFVPADALQLEATIVRTLERTLGVRGGRALHEWVCAPERRVTSIPEVDPYDGFDDPQRPRIGPLPPLDFDGTRPTWRSGAPRVLAYLRARFIHLAPFLRAAGALRGDAVVVCPDATAEHVALARQLKLRLHLQPVSVAELLPRADLVVSHGGGMMGEALVRGRRCVAVPSHYEQFLTAMALHGRRLGVVLDPAAPQHYERSLRHALADAELGRNAAAAGLRHRGACERAAASLCELAATVAG